MLARVVQWVLRIGFVILVAGLLCVGLSMVWHEGPVWWALVSTPVFVFVGMGAAVWMADNL